GFSEGKTSIAAAWIERLDKTSMKIDHQESSDEVKIYNIDDEICMDIMPYEKILFVLALLNSLVVDFIIRNMVQINVSKTY
ncbi:hypothetical protein VWM66_10860, partial [Campylobacter jejuni]